MLDISEKKVTSKESAQVPLRVETAFSLRDQPSQCPIDTVPFKGSPRTVVEECALDLDLVRGPELPLVTTSVARLKDRAEHTTP